MLIDSQFFVIETDHVPFCGFESNPVLMKLYANIITYAHSSGTTMPMGFTETKSKWMSPTGELGRWIPYSEYIIEDSDQICLRYLVQFV